jgi:hypothetical protein
MNKKPLFIIIFCLLLSNCDNSPNKFQVKITMENMGCYKSMINEIRNSYDIQEKIEIQRSKKQKGISDPVTVKQEYRLIEFNEIDSFFSKVWRRKCYEKLKPSNSLKGIRYINKNSIILEVNKFNRHSIRPSDRYTKGKTIEIHRLIFSKEKLNSKNYQFKNENLVWTKLVDNNLTYKVYRFKI